jgi:threonine 3-dehydrogenase
MPANILMESPVKQEPKAKEMKCLVKEVLDENGLAFRTDAPEPVLRPGEVKIKVLAAAVCGTDKGIYNSAQNDGIRKEMQRYLVNDRYVPIVIGHEFCGIVEEVDGAFGADERQAVDRQLLIEPGDYVTAEMHLSCGHCSLCRTGNEHICPNVRVKGIHLDGCFTQTVTVPYKNVILLGKNGDMSKIPPRIGSMLDAFGNAVHTVMEADVRGKSVAILGAGPLGLMAAFLCRDFGASRIYMTEAADTQRRFAIATEFGVDACFDVSKGASSLYRSVETHETSANGVDVVLEMSGSPSAYQDAFQIVRNGGTVLLLGITRKPLVNFDIANFVIWKGVTVKGIFGRRMFETWETMLSLLRTDSLDVKGKLNKILCQKTYALDQYKDAFAVLSSGSEMKLVFTPDAAIGG